MAITRNSYNNENPDLADLAGMAAAHVVLSMVDTVKIGRIESYDAEKQTADVELLQYEPFEDEEGDTTWEQPAQAFDIPVVFFGGTGYGVSFPLAVGDFVLLLINERSLDYYKATGEAGPQTDFRRWDTQDALAVPLRTMGSPLTPSTTPAMVLEAPEIHLVTPDAPASISRDPEVQSNLTDIETALDGIQIYHARLEVELAAAAVVMDAAIPGLGTATFGKILLGLQEVPVPSYTKSATAVEEVKVP